MFRRICLYHFYFEKPRLIIYSQSLNFKTKETLAQPTKCTSLEDSHSLLGARTQSRQSARLFLQSYELGPPPPPPTTLTGECAPAAVPGGGGVTHVLVGEAGLGPGRGDRHCGTLGICVLCVPNRPCLISLHSRNYCT